MPGEAADRLTVSAMLVCPFTATVSCAVPVCGHSKGTWALICKGNAANRGAFRLHTLTLVFSGPSCKGKGEAAASTRPDIRNRVPKIEMIWPGATWLFGTRAKLAP